MAPLTWRNVDSPSFASANQLYTLAAELMNRGFNSASRGLDKFREITTDEQSARLMQDVMAAGNDPAAIQAAATRGNAAFLSPEALRFANAQPGVLLDRQQAEANIAQTGVRTNVLKYGLDRSRVTDGREDAQYAARQEANPLIYRMQELARNGYLSGAQALAAQNADLLSRAGINADTVYNGISSGFTGQMVDTERGVQHSDFMRIAGNATNARELIDLAGRAFATEAEARRGIQDLQAQGLISADLAQTALGSLGQAGLWTAPTAADEIMQRYGAAPMNGRGSTNPSWATGNNPVLNRFMSTVQRGGVTNPYALAAIQATGMHESGFDPGNAGRTWNDPSESGRPGTAGGIMSWNNDRLAAMQRFTGGDMSPEAQAAFFLQEDPQLITRLNNAGSVEEAQALMNNAWRFAGYNREGGEAQARLNTARSIYNGTPLSFGSNVPRAGTQPGVSVYDQMMAAAAQDPNRTPLTFGKGTWTPGGGLEVTVTDDSPVSSIMAAASADPATSEMAGHTTSLVSSPQAADDGGVRVNQMMAQVLAQPVEDVQPAQIVEAGTAGENPLFTEVDGGVVARPPMSQQETQLISRAARAGILQTSSERAARQREIDRYSQMMIEAGGQTPDISVRPERTDGTGFQNDLNAMMRNGDISKGINQIANGIATGRYGPAGSPFARGLGGLLDYFSVSPEEAKQNSADREAASEAIDWWRSPEAQSYFRQNPDQLQTAAQNPVLFARQMAERTPGQTPSQQQDQRQQTPARNQNEGQTPAATPTRPAVVTSTDLASLLRTAQSTERVDRSLNPFAPMDELLAGENALSGDAASVAQQLTADGGKLSYLDTRTVRENIRELMRIPGVNSAAVAGALLAQNGVLYTGTEWNPLNWGSDDQLDVGRAAEIWQQYQRPDAEGRTGIEAGVARLNNRGRTETAVQGIAQVQADYQTLVTAMNQRIAQAPNQAQKDAIRQYFERNVFPLLYAQVQAIGASGALTTNANGSTGR